MEFLKIWGILVRRKWIAIITFSVFFASVVIGTYQVTPIYEAKAKISVKPSESLSSLMFTLGLDSPLTNGRGESEKTYDTDITLITVNPLLENLISDLDLKDRDGETLKPGDLVKYSILNKIISRPYIKVEQYNESDILEIISNSTDPEEAAKMSNGLAELYIDDRLEHIRKEYTSVRIFIENQMEDVKQKYYSSLLEKKDFMVEEETVDTLTEIQNQLNYLSSLKSEYKEKEINIASKKVELTEKDPEVIALNRQKDLLKQYIEKAKDDLMKIPSQSIKKEKIELSLSVNQKLYQKLLEYLTEVGVTESMTLSNIRLIEPAVEPEANKPIFPKKILNYFVGFFLGLFWAFSLAFFVEYVDNTVQGPKDFEGYEFTFLGAIPEYRKLKGERLISNTDANDPVYEAYRKVLSSIRFATLDTSPKRLLISGIEPKSGSSTTLANLGILYAGEGEKVLLVDTDMRRPSLHQLFKHSNTKGLTDLLLGDANIENVIHESAVEGLSILPSGAAPPDPALLLKSEKMWKVISELEERYDMLLFDSAPLSIKNDAIVLMNNLDGMILIARNKATRHGVISEVDGFLENAKISPIGLVLNHV